MVNTSPAGCESPTAAQEGKGGDGEADGEEEVAVEEQVEEGLHLDNSKEKVALYGIE